MGDNLAMAIMSSCDCDRCKADRALTARKASLAKHWVIGIVYPFRRISPKLMFNTYNRQEK